MLMNSYVKYEGGCRTMSSQMKKRQISGVVVLQKDLTVPWTEQMSDEGVLKKLKTTKNIYTQDLKETVEISETSNVELALGEYRPYFVASIFGLLY